MAAFVGGRPLAVDVVGDRRLYASVHERLIGGYVLDALRARGETAGPEPDAAEWFRPRCAGRPGPRPQPWAGGAYGVLSGAVVGGELENEERTVHVSAFPPEGETEARPHGGSWVVSDPPLPPPSRRRA